MRFSTAFAFWVYELRVNGPAPTGRAARPAASASKAVGLTIIPVLPASRFGSWKSAWVRDSTTVCGSGAVISLTCTNCGATSDFGSLRPRSRLFLTAAASSGEPSLKVRPGRSLKVTAVPSGVYVQPVASAGTASPFSSSLVRPA